MGISGTSDQFKSWKSFLQSADHFQSLALRSIVFESNEKSFGLVPFTELDLQTETPCELLLEWRMQNLYAYPTRSNLTYDSTRSWFKNSVIDNPNRVLFWIVDSSFTRLGHIGVVFHPKDNGFEIDNVLRGVKDKYLGLMSNALRKLEETIDLEFSPISLTLQVLESNDRAVRFYQNAGYSLLSKQNLTWKRSSNSEALVSGEPKDDAFLLMKKNSDLSGSLIPTQILTAGPSLSPREVSYVADAAATGWNTKHSDYLTRFENEFAEYVGSKHAMATSSCTGALHLALLALGIGPGDEVLVPEVTWVASASAVRYVGAKPIFVDVDPATWTIDPIAISKLVNSRTRAIIPVHLYGYAASMALITKIAKQFRLLVVEDAAPAIGTLFDHKPVGTFGEFGCFSFQGAKLLVTGEGGMLVSNNDELFAKAKKLQDHGRKPGTFWIEELGYKYKMNNLAAAFGLAQLERADNQIERKRRLNAWYRDGLEDLVCIRFQEEAANTRSICWMTSFTLNEESRISRDQLISELKGRGIDSRPVFPAISQYPIWGYSPDVQTVSKRIGDNGINLPSGVSLNRSSVNYVIDSIRDILG
jgi:perosamine synthetase